MLRNLLPVGGVSRRPCWIEPWPLLVLVLEILFLLGGLVGGLHAQDQPPWAVSYHSAVEDLENGDRAFGLHELENLARRYPTDPRLDTAIGAALDSASQYQMAASYYRKALLLDPQYEPALNNFALNLASRGELHKAIPLLKQVLSKDSHNGAAAYNLALITLRLKSYEEAARAFRMARNAPDLPAPLEKISLGEATALFNLRRYTNVIALLRTSAGCSNVKSCLLLGSAQALSDQLPSAVASFQTAVGLAPKEPDAYFSLALAFLQGKRESEAKETLAAGLEQSPNSDLLLYGQAVLDESTGIYDEATEFALKAIAVDPSKAEYWSILGTLHVYQGKDEQAEKAFRQACELGADVGTAVEYAELLVHNERYGEAEKILYQARRSHPDNAAVDRGLGKLYKAEGKLEQAITFLRRAETKDPHDADVHYTLAITEALLHRREEADREMNLFKKAKQERRFIRALEVASGAAVANVGEN